MENLKLSNENSAYTASPSHWKRKIFIFNFHHHQYIQFRSNDKVDCHKQTLEWEIVKITGISYVYNKESAETGGFT